MPWVAWCPVEQRPTTFNVSKTMPQRALQFGNHDGAEHRATTWKLWTETADGKSDVYLTNLSLGATLKASLHQSGKWHIAYSKSTFENKVKGAIANFKDRFIEKWPRPTESRLGSRWLFALSHLGPQDRSHRRVGGQ